MAAPTFIDTEDLTDFLHGEDANNAAGTIVVDAACDMCRTFAEQTFTRGTTTFNLNGSGTEVQLLPEYPIGTVTSVSEQGTVVPTTDWVLDTATGSLIRRPTNDYVHSNTSIAPTVVWDRGRQNISVACIHGWTTAEFPTDLRITALTIAARLYKQSSGAVFESLGDRSVRYEKGPTELTAHEMRTLRKYKRER